LLNKQHGAHKEGLLSNDQPGVLEQMPGDDIENHVGTGYGVLLFLLILQKFIITPFLDILIFYILSYHHAQHEKSSNFDKLTDLFSSHAPSKTKNL
jgi:hypothetical protein